MLNGKQNPIKSNWGKVFDELKNKRDLRTDAELATYLDVTKAFISSVRSGRRNISIPLAEKIFASLERDLAPDEYAIFMPVRIATKIKTRTLNPQLHREVRERAMGNCEYCLQPAPFKTTEGEPYLEVHHLLPLAAGGTDAIRNVVALCPNCHRRFHLNPPEDATTFQAKHDIEREHQ